MHPAELMFRMAHGSKLHTLEGQARGKGVEMEWRVLIPSAIYPSSPLCTNWCEQPWEAYDAAIWTFYYSAYPEYCVFDNMIGDIGRFEFDELEVA